MKYCNVCEKHVEPVKADWNWKWFILLVLTVVGWIPYVIYHVFLKKNNRCSICQSDELSKFSPEERAENKKRREMRKAKRAAQKGEGNVGFEEDLMDVFDDETENLLKKADIAFEEGEGDQAVKLIDKALDIYEEDEDVTGSFPLYKKKAFYLYKSGRNDEAWELYNHMYSKCDEKRILLAQLFNEKRKMLEFEGKYLGALREAIMAKIYYDWCYLDKDRSDEIDYDWTEDDSFNELARKAEKEHRWEEARQVLVEAYDDLENLDFPEVNKKVHTLFRK
ncbi:tetratricopeptide repeat protein [Isachenkonia alkalipeptolytica]|uniref:Tetratricopeptide repeat protein n=1 Tax=Isachenkonia alkalipeptolytica TaxID=2565777 RepID=A0AA43XHV9_9CLOT|nr:tetratricopeptide repeat protein [Isachenkonia alkalipeptolytica]NBG87123.1 tetratricopeptide repeat protein [Isachenkonia alkalipeptolytica]